MSLIAKLRSSVFRYYISKQFSAYIIGLRIFQLGLLFLAAAPVIAFLLLLVSSVLGGFYRDNNYFNDKYNYPLIFVAVLMLLNCILIALSETTYSLDQSSIWLGLSNWVPFFWCFWGFQIFLKNQQLRIKAAKLLVFGSLPVLISCFCQYFLKIYGPFGYFNNLIIWYQRPLSNDQGVTGLFNNQNYAGAWLCIIFPLCLVFLTRKHKNRLKTFLLFILSLIFVYMIVLTTSRGAILSIFISIFLFSNSIKNKFLIILSLISIPVSLNLLPIFPLNLRSTIYNLFPLELIKKTSLEYISNINIFPRIEIWSQSFEFIKANLITGYGAGTFQTLYKFSNGIHGNIQHSHNIFLEIAINHGLPSSLIIFFTIIFIAINSWKKSSNNLRNNSNNLDSEIKNFDKAWIISFLTFLFIHMFDITYFDGRISTLAWLLLAGMRSIIKEKDNKELANT